MTHAIDCVRAFTIGALLVSSSLGAAQAGGLGDLIGARGSSAESELQSRGYSLSGNRGGASMWWNGARRVCVSMLVDNGRVQSIENASARDCGQGGGGGSAAGLVAGAAIIGLAAALASHHRSTDNRHVDQRGHDGEYSRGYQDGLYGARYDTNDSEGYHEGYFAGEAEGSNRRAGNAPYVRSSPQAARAACEQRADQYLNMPNGTSVATGFDRLRNGNYDVVVSAGRYGARCEATASGRVIDINPE